MTSSTHHNLEHRDRFAKTTVRDLRARHLQAPRNCQENTRQNADRDPKVTGVRRLSVVSASCVSDDTRMILAFTFTLTHNHSSHDKHSQATGATLALRPPSLYTLSLSIYSRSTLDYLSAVQARTRNSNKQTQTTRTYFAPLHAPHEEARAPPLSLSSALPRAPPRVPIRPCWPAPVLTGSS